MAGATSVYNSEGVDLQYTQFSMQCHGLQLAVLVVKAIIKS